MFSFLSTHVVDMCTSASDLEKVKMEQVTLKPDRRKLTLDLLIQAGK